MFKLEELYFFVVAMIRPLCVTEPPDPARQNPDGSLKLFGPGGVQLNEPVGNMMASSSSSAAYPTYHVPAARHTLFDTASAGPPPLPVASTSPPPLPTPSRAPPRPSRQCPGSIRRED